MKKRMNRVLALLLVLCMALSLVPMAALAANDEQPEEVPAGSLEANQNVSEEDRPAGDDAAKPAVTTTVPDGATADTWRQIEGSKGTNPVDPAVDEQGRMVLKTASGNGNNLDNDNPAIFVDETMNNVFATLDGAAEKTLSFTVTPESTSSWVGFGFILFYNGQTGANAHGYYIGYPSGENTGWFVQYYGGTGDYPGFTGPDITVGQPVNFEIKWTNSAVTSFKIGETVCELPNSGTLQNVPNTPTAVAFKLGSKSSNTTTLRLSNVHYTGQAVVTAYTVSGTVKDAANAPVEGATVTLKQDEASIKTATTDASGVWSMDGVPAGNYTLTASKTDYADFTTEAFDVAADVADKTLTITKLPTVSGTVKCGTAAVEGVTVTLKQGETAVKTATTDAAGAFTMTGVPTGTYTLTATLAGYEDKVETGLAVNADVTGKEIQLVKMPVVSGTVKCGETPVPGATVTLTSGETTYTATTGTDGRYSVSVTKNLTYNISVEATGYAFEATTVTVTTADVTKDLTVTQSLDAYHSLETSAMTVLVSKTFPQVVQYRMKDSSGEPNGQVMNGNTGTLTQLKLNDVAVTPTVTSELAEGGKRVDYTLTVDSTNNNGTNINAVIHAHIAVDLDDVNDAQSPYKANTLGFYIDDVVYAGADETARNNEMLAHPIKTIEIPNHSLLSIDSTVSGGIFDGARIGGNTTTSTDSHYGVAENPALNWTGNYFVGFLSNEDFSAGLASNSEDGSGIAGSTNYPVRVTMSHDEATGVETFALDSTKWFYNYDLSASHPSGDDMHDYNALLTSASTNDNVVKNATKAIYVPTPAERPFARVVVVAGDQNSDSEVNWQDGAIAYRDTVLHIPPHSETVPNQVNLRISMNFGSMAANPFLIALDNVKRVAANTDGLGQNILLKGYAGEGHDSNHPDYYDIGERMGGAADFNTLLAEGKKLGAYFGVHVNASELYPESDAMSDEIVRRNTSGGLKYGWNWIDQGIMFSSLYDFGTGNRADRWERFHQAMGGDAGDNLDYIYVDVWGNGTGGTEDSWMTRRLSNEINQYWRIAHEWSFSNPYSSTLQHWVSDYTYGDTSHKGQLNSNVLRFLLNQYKDSFPPDFATFGGASNAPLLGGPAMQGFEGWQGDGEYDLSIYNTFNQMVSTKFLQHYEITNWVNAENTVNIPYATGANGAHSESQTSAWRPEMQITLKSADGADTVVVTRGDDATLDETATYSLANEAAYRSRVITLNGKVILKGAPASAGEDTAFPKERATLEYLIPWYWGPDGAKVSADKEKLYYWNGNRNATRSSVWELPDGWEGLGTVILYELSDQGRDEGTNVTVSGGQVVFSGIKPNTGYVVVKGAAAAAPAITYGTGLHLVDPSFNLDLPNSVWTVDGAGTAVRAENSNGISTLKLEGEVSVSQAMTDLTAGQSYVTYVAVDNRSDARATITIKDNTGAVVATNYTDRSIAHNYVSSYYLHNNHGMEAGGSYFQNMYVFFTPEAGKTYTLTLSRSAGAAGSVYFDDIRTTTTQASNYTYDESGNLTAFTQDFEHVAQGMWPFVVGPIEGVADNRQHLSELHAPYTQAGWDVKKLDDVIGGHWSIKVNGKAGAQNLVFQTIPQNFRFEPDKTYTVTFDYEMGSANSYVAVVGEGEWSSIDACEQIALEKTLSTTTTNEQYAAVEGTAKATVGHASFQLVGAQSGQTWIGIYSKDAPTVPVTGSEADFGGYKDFVLDNLSITVSEVQRGELAALIAQADAMDENDYTGADGAWTTFTTALEAAHTAMDNTSATQQDIDSAKTALQNAINALTKVVVTISGVVTSGEGDAQHAVAGATVTLEDEHYMPVGLTATTDAQGRYAFESTDEVTLHVQAYKIKVQATGYNVKTVAAPTLTKAAPTTTAANVTLEAEGTGVYVNDFDDKDISMMGYLVPDDTANLPTIAAADYNGSGALKITWLAGSGEARHLNNVVDKSITMANGSVSFDVTPLTNDGIRFGITFRGQMGTASNAARVFVGQEDSAKEWFVEYWNATGGNGYSAVTEKEIGLAQNVTRNIRATMNGTSFAVYVDGVEIYDVTFDVPTEAGYVGFNMRTEPNTVYMIDNLRIASDDAPAAGSHTISGVVTDGTDPVAGATVTVYTAGEGDTLTRLTSTTTNANGAYTTTALAAGTYTLEVTAQGYATATKTNVAVASENVTLEDIVLAADKTALQALYNEQHARTDGSDYTTETWGALTAALNNAETVLNKTNATAAEIVAAQQAITEAVSGLVKKPVDKAALRTACNTWSAPNAGDSYTDESWGVFQTALDEAKAVLNDPAATQSQVDAAVAALNAAAEKLVEQADSHTVSGTVVCGNVGVANVQVTITVTDAATAEVVARVNTGADGAYTASLAPGTYTITAEADGYEVTAPVTVTVANADVTAAAIVLTVDKTGLQELYTEHAAKVESNYTAASWAPFATALSQADTILKKASATPTEVLAATNELTSAAAGLVEKANTTELQALYDANQNKEQNDYTATSWAAFAAALEEAARVLGDDEATQAEVDSAKTALTNAVAGLVEKADKTALQTVYDAHKNDTQGNYTDASWATFTAALQTAATVLGNSDASQTEVDNAKTALENAIAGLAEKPAPAPAPGGSTRPVPTTTTEKVENPDGSTTTTVTKSDGTVTETTEKPDGTVTEKVSSPEEGVTITVTDAEGEVEVQVTVPATIPEVPDESRFADVPKGHWADEAIHEIAALGMVNGVNETEHVYDMSSAMTRGTIATVLYRFSHGTEGIENIFGDVAEGQWYTDGVSWAAKTGVVTGYNDGSSFGPNDVITREQMATMLARYAGLLGLDTAAEAAELDAFADGAKTSAWAANGIAWCAKVGILQGKGGNVLDPKANITRAEAAVMLMRFIELIK